MKSFIHFSIVLTAASLTLRGFAADGPGVPNVEYTPEQVGDVLSMTDPQKAISGTALHRGYLFLPLGADHGGGVGAGAFAFYDVSDPTAPVNVFDSRNDTARYHTSGNLDYVGDWAEVHHLPISGDLMMISERRSDSGGFSIFDAAPLYDNDSATKPRTISRYSFPGVTGTTNYDGYSFALGWQGRRYVYAPTGAQGLYIIDTTDLANPVQLKHMSRAALGNVTLRAAWPIGNMLILAEGDVQGSFNARIFDISDPGNPVQTGAFNGPFGYHGFVYGSSFYGGGTPIARHDFTNPANVTRTDLFANPGFDRPEYGYGKDGALFIGHYPGATKWTLDGDSVISAGRVNSGLVDDHAFLNPLGNLVVLCSDHNNTRKLILGVHGTDKDTLAPESLFTSPADGATKQNVLSRVGISFSDHVNPISANSSTIIVRKFTTEEAVPGSYSVMGTIVNFAPDAPLEANTTYDVILTANGVSDQVGNAVPEEIRVARFSTGSALNDYTTKVATTTPVVVNGTANLTLEVTNSSGLILEHSWNFGDGSAATAFSTSTTASHTYTQPGNHSVQVSTRIQGQTYAPAVNGVQVVHRPIPTSPPVNQSTIVIDPARALVWNVNKDNNSVSSINTVTNVRTAEIPVGTKPTSLAIGPNDRLWVVNKDSSNLSVINRATGVVTATHALPAGSSPHGIVIDAATGFAYVSLEVTGRIVKIDTADGSIKATLDVGPWPRGLALDPSRQELWVSRFISPDEGGKVTRIDLGTFTSEAVVALAAVTNPDSLQNGRGIPNYLAGPALSPDLTQGFVPSKKDNIFRGLQRDGQPLTFEHSVRSMAAHLDLATGSENPAWRLDFDNSDIATAAVFSPLGNMVFFATSGSAVIWAVDAYNPASTYSISAEGQAPDGMAISADGTRLYVHNFMDRSVTVFRSKVACGAVCGTAPREAKVATVATERLSAQVLLGKQLFYSTNDPRMAQEGYMSCASCHLDGGQDGRTWDFTNFGEGLRNSIDLNGRGVGHGPLHWTANFDEVQDFEGQIRGFAQGVGLMSNAAFHRGNRSLPLGESKAGLSADLDALAAYIASLTTTGRSPHRQANNSLSAAATAGKGIFLQENCASCHGGSTFSDSSSFARHNVGTMTAASGERLGGILDGFDTPTLRGLWHTAPYLHDGSAATLRDVLVARNSSNLHGNLSDRSSLEIDQLVAYLQSIDDLETTAPSSATGNAPVLTSPGNQSHSITLGLSLQLSATGTGTLAWEAISLPPGLSINASGLVSGAPSAVGTFHAQVAVRDSAGRSSAIAFTWVIVDPAARRYVKLVSLSSQNGELFTSLADFTLLGRDGQPLDRSEWTATASSQQTSDNNWAANAIDDATGSIWHTSWSGTAFPHHLTIDLHNFESLSGFTCLPRQSGANGKIKDYQLYVSNDGINWGTPVAQGAFPDNTSRQVVLLDSDGDSFSDYLELTLGTDPYSSASQPPASYTGMGGWWKLNEADGSVAINSAGPGHGTLMDAPTRVIGINGGALQFNGSTQSVQLPSPGINSNTVTLSAWVKRNGTQTQWAGIAFSRSGSNSGLGFGGANELRYHWNGGQYNVSSGLTVPDNTWTFCALVVEPTKATLYMKPVGGAIQTKVNNVAHAAAAFSGIWYLGQDPSDSRFFKGQLDDARIYTRALSAVEIADAANANHAPVFANNPITGSEAAEESAYSGTIAGSATDTDAGSTLTYSKVIGSAWLNVAPDGTLSGMPSSSDVGINDFTVRATDNTSLSADTILRIVVVDVPAMPTWTNPAGGSWPVVANWLTGSIANGQTTVADFSTLNLTSNPIVTLDGVRTLGGLLFGDTTPSNNWTLNTGSSGPLTLAVASGSPIISVANQTTTIGAVLNGSQGLVKSGDGTLILSQANSLTGAVAISKGVVRMATNTSLGSGAITLCDANTGTSNLAWLFQGGGAPSNSIVVANQGTGTVTLGTHSGGSFTNAPCPLTLNRATTLHDGTGDRTSFTGKISGPVGTLTVSGSRVTLDNPTNNFTGDVAISSGTIFQLNAAGALPSASSITNSGGTLRINNGGTHAFNALRGSGPVSIIAGGAATLVLGGADGSGSYSGAISNGANTLSLTKNGSGSQVLGGSNSYTGPTVINGGSLVINGSSGSSSAVTVNPGGTLGGTGAISGTVTNSGTLSPGSSSISNLTVNSMLTLAADSSIDWEIANWTGTAGTGWDKLTATALDLTATTDHQVTIRLNEASLANFSSTDKSFLLLQTTNGITGFDSAKFVIDASALNTPHGIWAVLKSDNNLVLIYTANPDANSNGIRDDWEAARFGNANAGANRPGNDADKDGLTNLMEYALDTDPRVRNAGPVVDYKTVTGRDYLHITVNKNPQATNLIYTVESCGALNDWSAANTFIEPSPANQLIVRDTFSTTTSSRRFIRLKVSTQP